MTPSPAPPVPLPDLVPSLRADLAAAGFTVEGIAAALGPVANEALGREQMLPADLATRDAGTPLATLVRLFTLGRPVPADAVSAALPTLGLEGLQRLGLVTVGEGQVRATCDLHPHADEAHSWWVASDLSEMATGAALAPDHVLGIGGASTTLAAWTPRPRVDRALDMGTGCGVQALHLSGHAGSTVATDLSRRALDFAAFNAAVNGLELDLRCGSLFEPVAGQRFQLIVSNPPFVITPRVSDVPLFEYRDGGLAGDALIEAVVRTIGEHLEPGGIGQFLGNWEVAEGADWRDRVRGWLEGTGLDAWVIQRDVQDPAQYAELWARDGGHVPGTPEYDAMYAAWLADFATRGVGSVGFGVVTVQRPATARDTWVELVEESGPVSSPMGPAILAGVLARTWLAEHGDDGVLATAWRCAEDVTEERHSRPGAEDPSVIVIRQGSGLRRGVRVDTVMAAFVSVCDGDLTAGQALEAIAALLEQDADEVRAAALPVVRELVADGFLLPA